MMIRLRIWSVSVPICSVPLTAALRSLSRTRPPCLGRLPPVPAATPSYGRGFPPGRRLARTGYRAAARSGAESLICPGLGGTAVRAGYHYRRFTRRISEPYHYRRRTLEVGEVHRLGRHRGGGEGLLDRRHAGGPLRGIRPQPGQL